MIPKIRTLTKIMEAGIVAASALKHTIPGDTNQVSKEVVFSLMKGDGSGRVQR